METAAPSPAELTAYLSGVLPKDRFAAIDQWLEQQSEDEVARLLEDAESRMPSVRLDLPLASPPDPGFVADPSRSRLYAHEVIGEGGMAVVQRAADASLEREVALKVLKPRRVDESLEVYHLRAHTFRREAALTASLDHPAIPPVYDIGRADGRPAFTMKRLSGSPLDERLRDEPRPAIALVEVFLRAVEAIAFAHSRGIVHRDLTPANILVADYGAVYVLDWGVAAQVGEGDGIRVGTPAWMAPEQAMGAPADPRMDVFSIGALLHLVLTGQGPRPDPDRPEQLYLDRLHDRDIPRGLAAVIRRCLAEPAQRYPDAGAVVAELRRWLDEGITVAQEAGQLERAWLRLRRSKEVRMAAGSAMLLIAVVSGAWLLHSHDTEQSAIQRVERIAAAVDLNRPDAIRVAQNEVESLVMAHPRLEQARALAERLHAASDVLAQQARLAEQRMRFRQLLNHVRRTGPWPGESQEWKAALSAVGIDLVGTTALPSWQDHPLAHDIAESLVWAWRAAAERDQSGEAQRAAQALATSGPTPGWQALGRVCAVSRFQAHDPVVPIGRDAAAALAEPESAGAIMAAFAPNAAINTRAWEVLQDRPGDFWPLIAAARAALAQQDLHSAQHLGLVASGAEPDSMYPPLILAYEALARGDAADLSRAVGRGLRINPDHTEFQALQAVTLVRGGHRADAQAVVDRIGPAHLQYHLQHRVGHPMERTVDALVQAGLRIQAVAPDLGPVVPDEQRHQHH
jgi:tRNA A-37 threonylcarbamoyl transferase component Bud32